MKVTVLLVTTVFLGRLLQLLQFSEHMEVLFVQQEVIVLLDLPHLFLVPQEHSELPLEVPQFQVVQTALLEATALQQELLLLLEAARLDSGVQLTRQFQTQISVLKEITVQLVAPLRLLVDLMTIKT